MHRWIVHVSTLENVKNYCIAGPYEQKRYSATTSWIEKRACFPVIRNHLKEKKRELPTHLQWFLCKQLIVPIIRYNAIILCITMCCKRSRRRPLLFIQGDFFKMLTPFLVVRIPKIEFIFIFSIFKSPEKLCRALFFFFFLYLF